MKFLLLISALFAFFSCNDSQKLPEIPDLTGANNVIIYYKSDFDSLGRINVKSISIGDKEKISALKNMLEAESFDYQYCISSGAINFYKDSSFIYTFAFNTLPGYRHIAYNMNNRFYAVKLNDQNAELLEKFEDQ